MMSALTEGRMKLRPVKKSPQQMTRARKSTEKLLGKRIPVPQREIAAYKMVGKKPPTD